MVQPLHWNRRRRSVPWTFTGASVGKELLSTLRIMYFHPVSHIKKFLISEKECWLRWCTDYCIWSGCADEVAMFSYSCRLCKNSCRCQWNGIGLANTVQTDAVTVADWCSYSCRLMQIQLQKWIASCDGIQIVNWYVIWQCCIITQDKEVTNDNVGDNDVDVDDVE
jgi:hypothetical protein